MTCAFLSARCERSARNPLSHRLDERVDLFNYDEPFLYAHLVEALRHVREVLPAAAIAISTAFDVAFANLERFHRRAAGTGLRVIWQYVVFRWNDRDEQFRRI